MRLAFAAPLVLLFVGCPGTYPEDYPASPIYTVFRETEDDPKGVASARCPLESELVGGGCDCGIGPGQTFGALFGSSPAGNAYVCGCYNSVPVTAYALCLGSSKPSTIRQGLQGLPGLAPEAKLLADEFRARRDAAAR